MIGELNVNMKKKREITPEHLAKLAAGRKAWMESLTPEQRAAFTSKASNASKIARLEAQIRKLKAKKSRKVKEAVAVVKEVYGSPVEVTKGMTGVAPQYAIREEVMLFSSGMEQKLRKRDGYGGWKNLPLPYIKEKLKGELNELLVALDYETAPEVMSECIDVANYAMFLWDILRSGDPRVGANLVGRTKDQGRS